MVKFIEPKVKQEVFEPIKTRFYCTIIQNNFKLIFFIDNLKGSESGLIRTWKRDSMVVTKYANNKRSGNCFT